MRTSSWASPTAPRPCSGCRWRTTLGFASSPYGCAQVETGDTPDGTAGQVMVGPALRPDGTEPSMVLSTWVAHGGSSGVSSAPGPSVAVSDGTWSWAEPIPLAGVVTLAPGSIRPTDCGERPDPLDPVEFAPSKTAEWRVAGRTLVVGSARIGADGALELATGGSSCTSAGWSDVTLSIAADGTSVTLGGSRLPVAFPEAPTPGPVVWKAGPTVDGRATVALAGRFGVGEYAVELGGSVVAVDCREP